MRGKFAVDDMQVCPAYTACKNTNENLPGLRRRIRNDVQPQCFPWLMKTHGSHRCGYVRVETFSGFDGNLFDVTMVFGREGHLDR
jgi:hypothetical protein